MTANKLEEVVSQCVHWYLSARLLINPLVERGGCLSLLEV
ncbi:hypothetical protein TIFTF001_045546, partial [Ficus carica]